MINQRLETFQPTRRDDAIAAEYLERCGLFFRVGPGAWSVNEPSIDLPAESNLGDATLQPPSSLPAPAHAAASL